MRKYWWRNKGWITRSGQVIKVRNMSNSHIENCIRFFQIKGFISSKTLITYLNADLENMGDGAQLTFEREFLKVIESPVNPWIDVFKLELDYRNSHGIAIYGWNMKREKGLKIWIRKILTRSIS